MPDTRINLVVVEGSDRGKRFIIDRPRMRVGRGLDQDIILSDITVSRHHFLLERDQSEIRLIDSGSGNGTWINGNKSDSHILLHGDHIEIGQTVMRFEEEELPKSQPVVASSVAPVFRADSAGGGGARISSIKERKVVSPASWTPIVVMGVICLLGGFVIVKRTVFAPVKWVASADEVEFRHGLQNFSQQNFLEAKGQFEHVAQRLPDAPEVKRYLKLCGAELEAQNYMLEARRSLNSGHYSVAIRTLQKIDSTSGSYEEARRLRLDNLVRAAGEEMDELEKESLDDSEAIRFRLQRVLELDPGNARAMALMKKLKVSAAKAAAAVD